jgi:predicted MFS family arabinose efflux permease
VSGLAIYWLGTGPVFLANAVLCVAPVVSAARMRPADLHRDEPTRVARGDARIADAMRYVWHRPDLVLPMALMLFVGAFGFNFPVTLAVLSKNVFHTGAQSFGLLSTALAVGSLAGALAGTGRRSRPSVYVVLLSAAGFGVLETLAGFAPGFLTAALLLAATGFFMIFFAQATNQRVQLGTDAEFRGRVMALYILVFLGTTPVGGPLIGWCSEHFGARSGIWVGGLASLAATLVAGAVQLRRANARVGVHLRPLPHVHVSEPPRDGRPALDLRMPAYRPAAR